MISACGISHMMELVLIDYIESGRAADNARFASAGGDRAVFLWDVITGRVLRRFQGHFQVRGFLVTMYRVWLCD